jgi:hypothetical protein
MDDRLPSRSKFVFHSPARSRSKSELLRDLPSLRQTARFSLSIGFGTTCRTPG